MLPKSAINVSLNLNTLKTSSSLLGVPCVMPMTPLQERKIDIQNGSMNDMDDDGGARDCIVITTNEY
jgi:hypothetical protein